MDTTGIKITADSTCDLPEEFRRQHSITLIPLHILRGGEDLTDGVDVTPADIFARAGGAPYSTAAVNVAEYAAFFAPLSARYGAVVHVSLGSGFSSSYANACLAAAEFSNVFVVDSRNLSCGQGLLAAEGCRLAAEGRTGAAVAAGLWELVPRVESTFLLSDLDFLVRGGRCSAAAALGANLLRLKICIGVTGGAMQVVKKYRGSYEKCLSAYLRDRLEGRETRGPVFVAGTGLTEEDEAVRRETVEALGPFSELYFPQAGCTVSCHCGPRTVGVVLLRA